MTRTATVLALVAALMLASCGRRGDVEAPDGARADAPRVPPRGTPVIYPY
jgi:hypothetical protein